MEAGRRFEVGARAKAVVLLHTSMSISMRMRMGMKMRNQECAEACDSRRRYVDRSVSLVDNLRVQCDRPLSYLQ